MRSLRVHDRDGKGRPLWPALFMVQYCRPERVLRYAKMFTTRSRSPASGFIFLIYNVAMVMPWSMISGPNWRPVLVRKVSLIFSMPSSFP